VDPWKTTVTIRIVIVVAVGLRCVGYVPSLHFVVTNLQLLFSNVVGVGVVVWVLFRSRVGSVCQSIPIVFRPCKSFVAALAFLQSSLKL